MCSTKLRREIIFYHNMKSKLFMTQRLVTWPLNAASGAQEGLHKRTEVHFQCSTGSRSHNAKTGYTTMSKAKGIKHSHDTTGCAYVRKTEKETDCGCRQGSQCETPVCTVTLQLFIDI